MLILYIALAILGVYIIFIFAPAVVAFFTVFTRKKCLPLDETPFEGTYYASCGDVLRAAYARMKSEPSREVRITARDGTELAGDLYERPGGRLAVLAHGYRSSPLNSFCVQACGLLDAGFSVLLIHQRAHGKSGGRRSSLGIIESRDLLDWLASPEVSSKRVLVGGVSMGAYAVARAGAELPDCVAAMIIDCGFVSPYEQLREDCRRRHLPWRMMLPVMSLLARTLLHIRLDEPASESLSRAAVPSFFLHGEADRSVPPESGRRLFAACSSEKDALFLPGAEHTLCYPFGGAQAKEKVFSFIDRFI